MVEVDPHLWQSSHDAAKQYIVHMHTQLEQARGNIASMQRLEDYLNSQGASETRFVVADACRYMDKLRSRIATLEAQLASKNAAPARKKAPAKKSAPKRKAKA